MKTQKDWETASISEIGSELRSRYGSSKRTYKKDKGLYARLSREVDSYRVPTSWTREVVVNGTILKVDGTPKKRYKYTCTTCGASKTVPTKCCPDCGAAHFRGDTIIIKK